MPPRKKKRSRDQFCASCNVIFSYFVLCLPSSHFFAFILFFRWTCFRSRKKCRQLPASESFWVDWVINESLTSRQIFAAVRCFSTFHLEFSLSHFSSIAHNVIERHRGSGKLSNTRLLMANVLPALRFFFFRVAWWGMEAKRKMNRITNFLFALLRSSNDEASFLGIPRDKPWALWQNGYARNVFICFIVMSFVAAGDDKIFFLACRRLFPLSPPHWIIHF